MNDDQRQLANAYLDGEVTAEERARADADPEVVAEVARLVAVHNALRVTERPDAARRDAAIAAALDAFEVRPAATIATTPQLPVVPPVSLAARRRRRWIAPLAAAAAAVVVIAGGVAVLRDGGDDADDAGSATLLSRDASSAADSAPEVVAGAAETIAPPATKSAAAGTTAARAEQATPAESGDAALAVLMSPEDLAAFASQQDPAADETTSEGAFGCALGEWVGSAIYQRDGQTVTVDVFVEGGEAVAADPTNCEVVARAQLP